MPLLNQVNLVVRDPDASRAFFALLGIELGQAYEWPPGSGAYHSSVSFSGPLTLEFDNPAMLRLYASGADQVRGPIIGFAFPTADEVDAAFARLTAANHPARQAPYDAFWGARYAIVEDPDGHTVGLMGPIDRTRGYIPSGPPS